MIQINFEKNMILGRSMILVFLKQADTTKSRSKQILIPVEGNIRSIGNTSFDPIGSKC
jgi:hypothetical protein